MKPQAAPIVFVFPPAHGNVGAFRNHLGVAYLRAALARDGLASTQYLNPSPGSVGAVSNDILKLKPRVVGFTVYDANFSLSLALAAALKRKQREIRVVFGGPAASFCAKDILERHPAIDACVLGEAEEIGADLFAGFLDGFHFPESQSGLAMRRDGRVVSADPAPLVGTGPGCSSAYSALDTTPSPYLCGVLSDGRIGLLTGRGCTHHCQYCCFAALGRKRLRLHSVERVLAELEFIAAEQKRTGQRFIVPIHDDAFTLAAARAKVLCQAIADKNLGLLLSCITRADALDDELLGLMRRAGFVSLAFGLESSVPSVLRATGKVRSPDSPDADLEPERQFVERVRTSVVAAKKHGFNVGVSIILGLPDEKVEDGAATLRFVKSLPVDYYMHNFLWVFPGTPLWETHERYGIGCEVNSLGLGTTTQYAYDLNSLRPKPKCSLEQDARIARLISLDALASCGSSSACDRGISVAVVNTPELSARTAGWLASVLSIGGSVVQVYPRLSRARETMRLYCDREVFGESRVPARHYIQVFPRQGQGGVDRSLVACSGVDLYCRHKPELLTFLSSDTPRPLMDWLRGEPTSCSFCDPSSWLLKASGFDKLLEETNDDLGSHLRAMPVPPALAYPGRWVRGKAPCRSLSRIEIDGDENVRVCRHGSIIGRVGDSKAKLRRRLAEAIASAGNRRECKKCKNQLCPRCPFPGADDRQYCGLMTRQKRSVEAMNWIHSYSRILSVVAMQRDRLGGD